MTKRYSELIKLKTFEERFKYLCCYQAIGDTTFGGSRYLNQKLYASPEWKQLRQEIIVRDNACDLGLDGYEIRGKILIHHINPITKEDILERRFSVFDPENLVCVSFDTHQGIHYGDESKIPHQLVERTENDTVPWR